METKSAMVAAFENLNEADRKEVAAAFQALAPPPRSFVGWLWLIIVSSLCLTLLGGVLLVFLLIQDDKSTDVVAAIVTGALGAVIGLLAPSPPQRGT